MANRELLLSRFIDSLRIPLTQITGRIPIGSNFIATLFDPLCLEPSVIARGFVDH